MTTTTEADSRPAARGACSCGCGPSMEAPAPAEEPDAPISGGCTCGTRDSAGCGPNCGCGSAT